MMCADQRVRLFPHAREFVDIDSGDAYTHSLSDQERLAADLLGTFGG